LVVVFVLVAIGVGWFVWSRGSDRPAIETPAAARGAVVGVAKDQAGKPYAHVQIAAVPLATRGVVDVLQWGEYRSDAGGRFRIEGLAPARYRIAIVNTRSGTVSDFEIDERMEPVAVDMRSDAVEIELVARRRGRVRFSVMPDDGKLGTTVVSLRRLIATAEFGEDGLLRQYVGSAETFGGRATLDAELEFEAQGSYVLVVEAEDYARWQSDEVVLGSGSFHDFGTVELHRGRDAVVTVRMPNGAPATDASVTIYRRGTLRGDWIWRDWTDENGRCEFERVPEGELYVVIDHLDAAPLAKPLKGEGDLNLEFRLAGGRPLVIRVKDGAAKTLGTTHVWLYERVTGRLLGRKQADANGEVRLPHAPTVPLKARAVGDWNNVAFERWFDIDEQKEIAVRIRRR